MKIQYDYSISIIDNIKKVLDIVNDISPVVKRNESNLLFNDNKTDINILELQNNMVESVIDEYNAMMEV